MEYVLPVLLGILSSSGIFLPGLLNITAAKICLKAGRARARIFSLGAVSIIFIQAYIAVSFAKFINRRPDIIYMLEEIGLVIFVLLTAYFFFFAKKPKEDLGEEIVVRRSKTGDFFFGVLLSTLNVFPIPFYVFASITFASYKLFTFTRLYIFLFILGAVIGSYLIFSLYIVFFKKFEHKAAFILKNINYFLGTITGIIAVITIFKIIGSS